MKLFLRLLAFSAFLSPGLAQTYWDPVETFTARVVGVADGDTVTVLRGTEQIRIRLEGIDCPEFGQDFGTRAKQFLSKLIFGKDVEIRVKETDRYGRLIARIDIDGLDTSRALVAAGLAWHYKQYSKDPVLAALEKAAREAEIGLWSHPRVVAPWDWRRGVREPQHARGPPVPDSASDEDASIVFRGNVRSLVFHAPSCPHFECPNCTRIFRSFEEARKAGFRPHAECVR